MASLYELKGMYMEVYSMMDDPTVDEQTIKDTLEGIEGEIEDKAEGYAYVIAQASVDSTALGNEIARLTARKRAIDNNITRLKTSLQDAMELTGKTKFKTTKFSFGIQNNPPTVVIEDPLSVPEQFLIPQEPKVDKTAIKDLLKHGQSFDWARLEQTKSLRIR